MAKFIMISTYPKEDDPEAGRALAKILVKLAKESVAERMREKDHLQKIAKGRELI